MRCSEYKLGVMICDVRNFNSLFIDQCWTEGHKCLLREISDIITQLYCSVNWCRQWSVSSTRPESRTVALLLYRLSVRSPVSGCPNSFTSSRAECGDLWILVRWSRWLILCMLLFLWMWCSCSTVLFSARLELRLMIISILLQTLYECDGWGIYSFIVR